jgi:hypothetical protein
MFSSEDKWLHVGDCECPMDPGQLLEYRTDIKLSNVGHTFYIHGMWIFN